MEPTSWVTEGTISSPFARPSGLLGRLAGWAMVRTNRRQEELLPLIGLRPGEHVLEVGHGPGALLRLLTDSPAERVYGVDPSPEMRAQASRRTRGRAEIREGSAQHTGYPGSRFDCVISVNNVALWPDLSGCVHELSRILRPGGRLAVAWHGGTTLPAAARRLILSEDKLALIEAALRERFPEVRRHELSTLTAFVARAGE
ncbi:class I SAM-dependent methyltransferase [Sphaerisporangium aureirubrum]|uniref:Class I SAM-dependent methyltransferase n=1 Tax=Sphaerisporangium aureirubrum TaxID=1544736 RepID=A0ABW1NUH3_9ACTN